MNKLFTLLSVVVLFATSIANAQNTRLIAVQRSYHNGTAMSDYDSSLISYKSGNTAMADAVDYNMMDIKWDTSVRLFYFGTAYQNFERKIYHYNAAGKIDTAISQAPVPAGTGPWTHGQKSVYAYNSNNDVTEELIWQWNLTTGQWDSSGKMLYTYAGTNLTSITQQYYFLGWKNSSRRSYAYTGNNMTQYDYETWDIPTLSWKPYSRQKQTYDASNNNDTTINTNWDAGTSSYINSNMATYTYNTANMQTSYMHFQWDVPGTKWMNWVKTTYTFNSSNAKIADSNFNWDNGTLTYTPTYASVFHYNAASLNDTVHTMVWDVPTSSFIADSRTFYTYNTNKQMTLWRVESWDVTNSIWTYAKNGDRNDNFYYTTVPVGISNMVKPSATIQVYPNPASSVVNIALTMAQNQPHTIAIYDMTGGLVKQWEERTGGNITRSIPVNDLTNGNYIISVRNATVRVTAQFSIIK